MASREDQLPFWRVSSNCVGRGERIAIYASPAGNGRAVVMDQKFGFLLTANSSLLFQLQALSSCCCELLVGAMNRNTCYSCGAAVALERSAVVAAILTTAAEAATAAGFSAHLKAMLAMGHLDPLEQAFIEAPLEGLLADLVALLETDINVLLNGRDHGVGEREKKILQALPSKWAL